MGITAEVLASVNDAAVKAGAVRVTLVRLSIGELTAIMPFALQFAWEAMTPGTLCEGAVLEITEIRARSRCLECGTEWEHDQFDRLCPSCGTFACEVLAGNELRVDGVDVDLPETTEG
jgi:hydrogenase nickel incorporation protein HypA/HybF